MLKYINYQLLDDEQQQAALEKKVAPLISQNIRQNIDAFRQHIPSMVSIIEQHDVQQFSIFCTSLGKLNIVDFATGRVYYGPDPEAEVAAEVADFCRDAPYFNLRGAADGAEWHQQPLPAKADVVLVFGLGLGLHLEQLLQSCRIRFLIVYEPSVDILMCSLQAARWDQLLELATVTGTHIFLQIGSDATGIPAELAELIEFDQDLNQLFVYRHTFHPMMDDVIHHLMSLHGQTEKLLHTGHQFSAYSDSNQYVAERAANVLGNRQPVPLVNDTAVERYNRNMTCLQRLLPKVHQTMLAYQNKHWQLVFDDSGQANLFHARRRALLQLDLANESETLVRYFEQHPFKDDVVLNQRVSRKVLSYLHFQKIQALQPLLTKTMVNHAALPHTVESLIVFGVALGKHIELLTEQHDIRHLYICEPNLDFFAASLYVTDWEKILTDADERKARIYLNLGGDGSHYFYDLMAQFYQVGAYSIADTYMLSSYYNVTLQKSIGDLRSELKVVLAMGEYYDHARFGLAHTYFSLANGYRYLRNDTLSFKQHPGLDLPVFIVGNGPSLDHCFEYLRTYREQVVIISCGTALRSLHSQGIQPDFHAEIEQNRATFDWISQIQDPDYLKEIHLLSVNGIHPDTAALFKSTHLCFKDGEASTYIYNNGLKKRGIQIASLAYAYPTVTNMVINFAIKLGFKYFYLFGVDLGFVDINCHHSQHSSYYKADGSQVYNYQARHGGGVPAVGNFRPTLFTKPEFDVSRKLIEQAIGKAGRKIEVYNCSDGVKIKGTVPLQPENILLDAVNDKAALIASLLETAFYPTLEHHADPIYAALDPELFHQSMQDWLSLLENDAVDAESARALLHSQWDFMRKRAVTDNDPTFCLFHGSSNFIAAVLTKIAANIRDADSDALTTFNDVLAIWRSYLQEGMDLYLSEPLSLDQVDVNYLFTPPETGATA
jgi:hypothetical protein